MKNSPKVSLITVYYNRDNAIEDSMNSLISQTYNNLEIIIVDDFSSDNTFEELKKMEKKDSRIKLYRNEKNCGFTMSLINTINMVNSKFIAIHGAGDISSITRIEEQVRYLEENPSVGVLSTDLFNERGEHLSVEKDDIEITTKDLLTRNFIAHGSVMFRLSDYKKVGGYRAFFTYRQDKDLWYRMSLVTKIHFYPKKLYKLIKQDNSVTNNLKKTPVPLLLSEFATFLIKERLAFGYDSLDIYKDQAALFYNPTKCNKHFYFIVKVNILNRNFSVAIDYIDFLIMVNVNFIHIIVLKTVKKLLKVIFNAQEKKII